VGYIALGGARRELKHLISARKRNKIDSLSSGERKGNSLNRAQLGVAGSAYEKANGKKMLWNGQPQKVKVLYLKLLAFSADT